MTAAAAPGASSCDSLVDRALVVGGPSRPAVASASIRATSRPRASELVLMSYERCVRLGRWALLIALLPLLAIAATLVGSGALVTIGVCVYAVAAPLAFVLALVAVVPWRLEWRDQPMPVCAVIAHLLATLETTFAILVVLAFATC